MDYTIENVGRLLKEQLQYEHTVDTLANWANDLEIELQDSDDEEVSSALLQISAMSAGEEFEFTMDELKIVADRMIRGDKHPFKNL